VGRTERKTVCQKSAMLERTSKKILGVKFLYSHTAALMLAQNISHDVKQAQKTDFMLKLLFKIS
jgi:hypothetical protein